MSRRKRIFDKADDQYAHISDALFDVKLHYWGYEDPRIPHDPAKRRIKSAINKVSPSENHLDWFQDPKLDKDCFVTCCMTKREFNEEKPTKMRLGKFLSKIVGWTDQQKIKDFVDSMRPSKIQIARTAAEIRWVYDNSEKHCDSCMSGKFESWKEHPVEVYATGELALYYTMDHANQHVTNRTLVHEPKKLAIRLYGNATDWFRAELASQYQLSEPLSESELSGIKLNFIMHDRKRSLILMPYIDVIKASHIGRDKVLRMGRGNDNVLARFSYTQDGTSSISCYICHETDKQVTLMEVIRAKHPSDGSARYFDGKVISVDPWGYANLRGRGHDSHYYINGYPRHFQHNSSFCPVLNRRSNMYQFAATSYGSISWEAIFTHLRRDFLSGELVPKADVVIDKDGRAFRRSSLIDLNTVTDTDTSEMVTIDSNLALKECFVPEPATSRLGSAGLKRYVKLSELITSSYTYDEIDGRIKSTEMMYKLSNGGWTSVIDSETGERPIIPEVDPFENFDPAAWGIDPDAAAEAAERKQAEKRFVDSGVSLSDIIGRIIAAGGSVSRVHDEVAVTIGPDPAYEYLEDDEPEPAIFEDEFGEVRRHRVA